MANTIITAYLIATMFKILDGIIHIPTELPIVTFNTSQTQGHNYKLNQLQEPTRIDDHLCWCRSYLYVTC